MQKEIQKNADITASSEQEAKLKSIFPSCFDVDGRFRSDKLEEILRADGADITQEGYKLDWLGKSYARLLANLKTETLLAPNAEHNAKPENADSQNLLIQGDNLDVLKHLVKAYPEKIKMIYIDPPYNTGSDGFVYSDDRKFTSEQLARLAGIDEDEAKRILEFTQSKSNSHSAWLTFMYPRLYVARELLHEDGAIFISIDENEQSQLKLLCDEVFGEENFLGQIIVLSNPKGRSQDKYFATNHEYLLSYSKTNLSKGALSIEKSTEQILKDYKEVDEFGGKYRILSLRNTHREFGKHNRANLYYPFFADETGAVSLEEFSGSTKILPHWDDGFEGCWTWDEKKAVKDRRLLVAKVVKGQNGKPDRLDIFRKSYASGSKRMIKTYLSDKGVQTEKGQDTFNELFGAKEKIFNSPKPLYLLQEMLSATLEDNEIALDFFGGSGSTAHATMELNAIDGLRRRFIIIQIQEATDEKSEARKAGYNTIFEITHERILRAANKIRNEYHDATCDFGFKEFKTIPANTGLFAHYLDNADTMEEYVLFDGIALNDDALSALMTSWKVYDGLPLHQDLVPINLAGYTAYMGGHILYFVHNGLDLPHITEMLRRIDEDDNFVPRKLVVFHHMFESKTLREFSEAVNAPNRKHLELTFEQRF